MRSVAALARLVEHGHPSATAPRLRSVGILRRPCSHPHWGLCDPAAVEGGDEAKRTAFAKAHALIRARLLVSLALPDEIWTHREALQQALDRIGCIESGGGDAESAL